MDSAHGEICTLPNRSGAAHLRLLRLDSWATRRMIRNSDVFLPVTFNRMSRWPGHRPGICGRLQAILDRAAQRPGGLSLAERALLTVCECWSAVATKSLEWHLGAHPEQRLRSLAMVYTAMGAKRSARAMESTLKELVNALNDLHRQQRIAALEVVMIKDRRTVEEMIGRFAMRLQPATQDSALRPAASVAVAAVAAVATVAIVPSGRRNAARALRKPAGRTYVGWRTEHPGVRPHDPG